MKLTKLTAKQAKKLGFTHWAELPGRTYVVQEVLPKGTVIDAALRDELIVQALELDRAGELKVLPAKKGKRRKRKGAKK